MLAQTVLCGLQMKVSESGISTRRRVRRNTRSRLAQRWSLNLISIWQLPSFSVCRTGDLLVVHVADESAASTAEAVAAASRITELTPGPQSSADITALPASSATSDSTADMSNLVTTKAASASSPMLLTTPTKPTASTASAASTPARSGAIAAAASAAAASDAARQLGSPRLVPLPEPGSVGNPLSILSQLGLSVEADGSMAVVSSDGSAAASAAPSSGFFGGSSPVKGKPAKRKLTLKDFQSGGLASNPAADTAIAAVVQDVLTTKAGLLPLRLSATAGVEAPATPSSKQLQQPAAARVLASRNWEAATTLVVVVPSQGMPPGCWDTHAALVAGVRPGSILPYVETLAGPRAPASQGLLLLNPHCMPGTQSPVQHILAAWDALLANHPSSADAAFITHGTGADLVLALLTDPVRGIPARARTKAVAMISPKQPPRQVLNAIVASSTSEVGSAGSGPSRAAAGILRTQLRQKAVAWHGELRTPVSAPKPNYDGSLPLEIQEVDVLMAGGASAPHYSDDYGCIVHPIGLAIPGTAAYREEAQALADGYAPHAARKHVLSFLKHMIAAGDGSANNDAATAAANASDAPSSGKEAKSASAASWAQVVAGVPVAPAAAATAGVPAPSPAKEEAGASATAAAAPVAVTLSAPAVASTEPVAAPAAPQARFGKSKASLMMAAAANAPPAESSSTVPAAGEPASSAAAVAAPAASVTKTRTESSASGAVDATTGSAAATRGRREAWAASPSPSTTLSKDNGAGTGLIGTLSTSNTSDNEPSMPFSSSSSSLARSDNSSGGFIAPPSLPEPYSSSVAKGMARLQALHLDAFRPGGGTEWKAAGTSTGVRVYSMSGEASKPEDAARDDAFAGARGDSILPFPAAAVHALLIGDPSSRHELDPQLDKATEVEVLSPQCKVERIAMKGVFPTDPRDFATLSCWQVNEEGALTIIATSIDSPQIPVVKGYVRGKIDVGGWIISPLSAADYNQAAPGYGLKPVEGRFPAGPSCAMPACRVSYLFRTSIGGSVPKFVVQQVTTAQAKLPATVCKALEKRYAGKAGAAKLAALPPLTNVDVNGSSSSGVTKTEDPTAGDATDAGAAAGESDTASATSTDADAAASGDASSPSTPHPIFNLSGVWRIDRKTSQPLEELLKEMGVPWLGRKMAESIEVVSTVKHTPEALSIEDATPLGVFPNTYHLDWQAREVKGADGKKVTVRAVALAGVDEIGAADDVEALVAGYQENGPPALPDGQASYPAVGPGAGCIITSTILPDGAGWTRDQRHLVSPSVMRLITVYWRDGKVRAKVTRYLNRQETEQPAPPLSAPKPPPSSIEAEAAPAAVSAAPNAAVSSLASVPTQNAAVDPQPALAASAVVDAPPAAALPSSPAPQVFEIKPTLAEERAAAAKAVVEQQVQQGQQSDTSVPPPGWSYAKWIPDDQAVQCNACKQAFSALNRVHHCRACGQAFCDGCTAARLPLAHFTPQQLKAAKLTSDQYVRMCDACASPFITSATSVTSKGGQVTLTGGNFGTADMASLGSRRTQVIIEGSLATGSTAGKASVRARGGLVLKPEHTSVTFTMPPGIGSRMVRVEVEGRTSKPFQITYQPVSLTSAEPVETDGGLTILRGTGLPGSDAELLAMDIRLNGNPCRAERVVEPYKAVQVRVPDGSGGANANTLTVVAGGVPSTAPLPFAYSAPELFAGRVIEEPAVGQAAAAMAVAGGGQSVPTVLSLVMYGASLGKDASAITVTVAGAPCKDIALLVPHAKLRATLPEAALTADQRGDSLEVVVTVAGLATPFVAAQ